MDAKDKTAICARVKQARTNAGLEQDEIGDMLQPPVSDRTIYNYETHRPPFKYLRQWAEITGVEYDWLLRGDAPPANAQAASTSEVVEELRALREEISRLREEIADRTSTTRSDASDH